MKGIYKTIIGIATTGAVATAGIITANVLSENKENEETKPVAVLNEMENTVNEENKIEENIVESNIIENNIQDNNTQKSNTKNNTTSNKQVAEPVETPQEPIKNIAEEPKDDTDELQINKTKTGNIEIDTNSLFGDDVGRVGIVVRMNGEQWHNGSGSGIIIVRVAGQGIGNIEVKVIGPTTLNLTGIIDFNDENPRCIFK